MCSVNSHLGQEVEENYLQQNDKPITIRSSTNLTTEQVATKDSMHLSTQEETVTNDLHINTEQTEIKGSGCETELSDTQNNAGKDTEISTLHCSDMKQSMADQTHVQIPTTNSESSVTNSEISDSIPHEPESPVIVPQDCTLTEHEPVLLGTASQNSSEKSEMVSWQFDNCDAGFPLSDSASHMLNMTKPEMDELRNKAEVQKGTVS